VSDSAYRPDIDGLRALAVLSVILYHVNPLLLSGGFLGVDIFFVISGYLISLILFRELARGEFSFSNFYVRRIRRLFPALIAVLLACLVFGGYALFAEEYERLGRHAFAAILFLLNLLLMREAGYFDVVSDAKPLLHLWSLSVEEQFYVVWPILLVLATRWRVKFGTLIGVAAAGSFLFALYLGERRVDALYFHPLARFWELLFGAGLAHIHHRFGVNGLPALARFKARHVLSIGGLVAVVTAIVSFDGKTPHPGAATLQPLLGAVVLIACGPSAIANRLLAFKPLVWIGLISYPLYLWHWPILSFIRIMENGMPSQVLLWSGACTALIMAWGTYYFVESPIRHAPIRSINLQWLVAGMAVLFITSGAVWRSGGLPDRERVRHAVEASLMMKRVPATDELCLREFPPNKAPFYCRLEYPQNRLIAVIGDSHAHALYPGISERAASMGYGTLLLANSGCPPLVGTTWGRNYTEEWSCAENIERIINKARGDGRIAAVVLATRGPQYILGTGFGAVEANYNYPPILPWGEGGAKSEKNSSHVFEEGLENTVRVFQEKRLPVVYMLQVPELGVHASNCVTRPFVLSGGRSGCVINQDLYKERMYFYRKFVDNVVRRNNHFGIADPVSVFCNGVECNGRMGGQVLYADDNHVNPFGARLLAPLVFSVLDSLAIGLGRMTE
jgi:peptidoglycan/LPS O-acetylase OafA/YrhL